MKTLFLVRHAKTRKAAGGEEDHGRALMPEGEQQALALGRDLARDRHLPELILASDSLRTRQTSLLIQEGINSHLPELPAIPTRYLPELYQGGPEDILGHLAGQEAAAIMVVGHNPCMEEAIEILSGEYGHVRPGTCVVIEFDIRRWEELYARPLPLAIHHYRGKGD